MGLSGQKRAGVALDGVAVAPAVNLLGRDCFGRHVLSHVGKEFGDERFLIGVVEVGLAELVAGMEGHGRLIGRDALLRVVGQRLTTTTQQPTNSVFVQLELNGLARIGTSPLDLLRRSVPGYLRTNDPAINQRDRSFDPLPEL